MNNDTPDYAIDYGLKFARKVFAKRGNHSEVHIGEAELAALLAIAAEQGMRAALKLIAQNDEQLLRGDGARKNQKGLFAC